MHLGLLAFAPGLGIYHCHLKFQQTTWVVGGTHIPTSLLTRREAWLPGPCLLGPSWWEGSAYLQRAYISCFSMLSWQEQAPGGWSCRVMPVTCMPGPVCLTHLAHKPKIKLSNSFSSYTSDTLIPLWLTPPALSHLFLTQMKEKKVLSAS